MLLLSEMGDGWEAEAVFPLGRVTGRIFMVLYCRVVVSMHLPYRIVGFAQKISFWPIFCSVHAQNCRLVRYSKWWWSSPSEDASLVG